MDKVYKYKIYCETDAKWENIILEDGETAPTICPVDAAHTVTAGSASVIDQLEKNQTKQEKVLSKGGPSFAGRGFKFTAAASTTTTGTYTFTENLNLKEGELLAVGSAQIDKISANLQMPDGGGGWITIYQYLVDFTIDPSRTVQIKNEALTESNFNGLRMEMIYDNSGASPVEVGVNFYCYSAT